jgi:ubiquinone/menaquinone biosynthesis C-methylase UbiE
MSSYAFMKFLESAPERYDRGIRWLSGGRIEAIYEQVAVAAGAGPGKRVLDIGCGTGGVALACARRGAAVAAIDVNPGMLEIAKRKALSGSAGGRVEWIELGAAEIADRFPPRRFDAVASCLAFSEMSSDEVAYALRVVRERLVPGGRLVLADEVEPPTAAGRLLHRLRRLPLAAVTWLLTQATTHPVTGLPEAIRAAGFTEVTERRPHGPSFALVTARSPGEPS